MTVRTALLLGLAVAGLAGATPGQGQTPGSTRGDAAAGAVSLAGSPAVTLTRVTSEIGLTGAYTEGNSHMGGVAWVDYNGDYWPDLFITNGGGFDHYLFRNEGDGTFTDVSNLVHKPDISVEDGGVCFVALDNDGDEDIVVYVDSPQFLTLGFNVSEGGPNLLYRNNGDGTFSEDALAAGIVDPLGRRNDVGGLADYDHDGYLDLYLGHWQRLSPFTEGITDYDRMLHNDGDGTFTDSSAATRVNGYGRDPLAVCWFDANMDGWQDLYVANTHPYTTGYTDMDSNDTLYVYDPTRGRFWDETGNPRGVGDDSKAAMGVDVGDIDNDGDWDVYVTDVYDLGDPPPGNALYLGTPEGRLLDNEAPQRGVATDTQNVSWPCNFTDFDNDGWVDLWVGTGEVNAREFLFLNDQDGTFTEVSVPDFTSNRVKGGSVADYDGDGDMDIASWNEESDTCIFRNDTDNGRSYIQFKLFGNTSNRSAIGATVFVTVNGETQMRRVSGGDSAHSQQELLLTFGVDQATVVDEVVFRWPNGNEETFNNVPANRLHFVGEGQGPLPESLVGSTARWSTSAETLTVVTASSYGGRAQHFAQGYGFLTYFADTVSYRRVFNNIASAPATVSVVSDSGASWSIPVTIVP